MIDIMDDHLVGGETTPLKNMTLSVGSWDGEIPS